MATAARLLTFRARRAAKVQSSASRWELFDRKWPREYRCVPGHPRTTERRGVTNKTSDYLKHANDCRMLAKQAKIEEHKDMLVNMAASWEMLAESRSRCSEVTKGAHREDDDDA
jgi:hypothetical protein